MLKKKKKFGKERSDSWDRKLKRKKRVSKKKKKGLGDVREEKREYKKMEKNKKSESKTWRNMSSKGKSNRAHCG